jgi:hypothetical protein
MGKPEDAGQYRQAYEEQPPRSKPLVRAEIISSDGCKHDAFRSVESAHDHFTIVAIITTRLDGRTAIMCKFISKRLSSARLRDGRGSF